MTDADGVAIGRGARDALNAEAAAGAGDILHDDRLAERYLHALAENPPDRVRRPAWTGRRDQGDGARRIALRLRAGDRGSDTYQCSEQCSHAAPPTMTFSDPI